jgi:hypothetical protein
MLAEVLEVQRLVTQRGLGRGLPIPPDRRFRITTVLEQRPRQMPRLDRAALR